MKDKYIVRKTLILKNSAGIIIRVKKDTILLRKEEANKDKFEYFYTFIEDNIENKIILSNSKLLMYCQRYRIKTPEVISINELVSSGLHWYGLFEFIRSIKKGRGKKIFLPFSFSYEGIKITVEKDD